ncbi:MAG TPA: hypothetical protein VKU41_12775 [Polyangiaceae bacterium]|nr:hypothetical protein [Polyangiaceae bacterium]
MNHCACEARTSIWRRLPALPAITLVLLPKCPACLVAWAGVLGAWGAGRFWHLPLGVWIALVLAATVIGAVTVRAIRTRQPGLALAGCMATGALLAAKFFVDSPPLVYGAALVLILTATGDRWVRRSA